MSYTSTHKPSEFRISQGFFTIKGRERYGWQATLLWPEKKLHGLKRCLSQACGHVHRTADAASRCGFKAVQS